MAEQDSSRAGRVGGGGEGRNREGGGDYGGRGGRGGEENGWNRRSMDEKCAGKASFGGKKEV